MTKNLSLHFVVRIANRDELLDLLAQAEVSTGHWNGRRITIPGFKGEMTFSEVSKQVESHYQAIVEPMQLRLAEYEKKTRSCAEEFMRGPGVGSKLLGAALFLPWIVAIDALNWAVTPYPVMSKVEEKRVVEVLSWRKKVDSRLDSLFTSSQQNLDGYAERSCIGSIVRAWDFFLDKQSNWRNVHAKDEKTLQRMTRNRYSSNSRQQTLNRLTCSYFYLEK